MCAECVCAKLFLLQFLLSVKTYIASECMCTSLLHTGLCHNKSFNDLTSVISRNVNGNLPLASVFSIPSIPSVLSSPL